VITKKRHCNWRPYHHLPQIPCIDNITFKKTTITFHYPVKRQYHNIMKKTCCCIDRTEIYNKIIKGRSERNAFRTTLQYKFITANNINSMTIINLKIPEKHLPVGLNYCLLRGKNTLYKQKQFTSTLQFHLIQNIFSYNYHYKISFARCNVSSLFQFWWKGNNQRKRKTERWKLSNRSYFPYM